LEEALRLAHHTGERCYEAEIYRLKGELIIRANGGNLSRAATGGQAMVETSPLALTQAEESFDQAIKIARRQEAKSLELRAVMSIARLYQKQGKQEEAGRLLSQTCSRFAEGFDTADLREAKALLDQLL
jgi:adenylate cyclase